MHARSRVALASALLAASCAGPGARGAEPERAAASEPEGSVSSEPERAASPEAEGARATEPDVARCDPASLSPPLASYDAIAAGLRFSLEIARDERGAWQPAASLPMPMHHASSILWVDRAALDATPGSRVRVEAEGIGRTSLELDEDRHTWFATYQARVLRVCPIDAN